MQAVQMSEAPIRSYLAALVQKRLPEAPPIDWPSPVWTGNGGACNWTIDLSTVETFGYRDLLEVILEETRQSIWLKTGKKDFDFAQAQSGATASTVIPPKPLRRSR